ncbi:hypothetical protein CcCBS67573_g05681 [Chytriomyces confervae]|uniref:Ras-GEF domain-containing protein n=1 Tax=Chytriomyces confervae TaxID=246404 RepID=A0A507FA47_9FUNG|nr:hypothetical protein CcCBS67573_g05681 [Chytriomyces confervae]
MDSSSVSLSSLGASVSGQNANRAKCKKSLVQCRVCCGSSWVHNAQDGVNVDPAPFPASSDTAATSASSHVLALPKDGSSASLGLSFVFSPKPHCKECSKCSACTNGKQIQSAIPPPLPSHGVTAPSAMTSSAGSSPTPSHKQTIPALPMPAPKLPPSPTSMLSVSALPDDQRSINSSESKRNLTKKKESPISPSPCPSEPTAKAISSQHPHVSASQVDKQSQMDIATFATLDTPNAVAAVSISRIGSKSQAKALRIVNGDDDESSEASSDENSSPAHANPRIAKRNADIKRRVQIMGSADNLSILGSTGNLANARKASMSSLGDLRNSNQNLPATELSSVRKPMSMHNLSGSFGNVNASAVTKPSGSAQSSKETITVNSAGSSLSSLPNSKKSTDSVMTPQTAANANRIHTDLSRSGENLSTLMGSPDKPHHPAVNILSLGNGVSTRKRDTGNVGAMDLSTNSMKLANPVLADSTNLIGDDYFDREEFPDLIDLGTVFGTKNHPEATMSRLIWSARIYDGLRKEYLSKPLDEPVYPERPPSDEIKYRILENFDEGRLTTVTYAKRSNGTENISAGDSESLVDALIFPLNQDNSYTEVFLACYRFFLPASELLTSLIEWYNVELDSTTATPQQESYFKQRGRKLFRGRAAKVLLTWIKNHWHDFHVDKDLLDELNEFVGDLGEMSFGDSQRMTQAIREQRLSWYMTQYIPPFSARRAPAAESAKPWGILWEPYQFAAQLTLIDHHFFRQIRPDTYLCLLQKSVDSKSVAGDDAVKVLMDYVGWFRLISSYTASIIYKEDTIKKRTKAIKKFIKIAKECHDLNNFNTCFALIHGLKRKIVTKMTSAWDGLSAKYIDSFKELELLTDPSNGYANFWTELKSCGTPLIPFFAAYIHDLLEIHETEPVYTQDMAPNSTVDSGGFRLASTDEEDDSAAKEINFTKFYNLYSIVAEIEVWRSYSYNSVIPEAASSANDSKGDTSAVLLNHMKDWKVVEDSILDL